MVNKSQPQSPTMSKQEDYSKGIILLDDGWREVRTTGIDKLEAIIEKARETKKEDILTFSRDDAVGIYTKVFVMCHQGDPYNWSRDLYIRHGAEMRRYIYRDMVPAVDKAMAQTENDPIRVLKEGVFQWHLFVFYNKWVTNLLRILDRVYAEPKGLPTLTMVSQGFFEMYVFEPLLEWKITTAVLDLIRLERDEQRTEMDAATKKFLLATVNMIKLLDNLHEKTSDDAKEEKLHMTRLEHHVVDDTRQYYVAKRQSLEWKYLDSYDYFAKAQATVNQEQARCEDHLYPLFVHNVLAVSKIHSVLLEELFDNAPVPPPPEMKGSRNGGGSACAMYVPVVGMFAGTNCKTPTKATRKEAPRSPSKPTSKGRHRRRGSA